MDLPFADLSATLQTILPQDVGRVWVGGLAETLKKQVNAVLRSVSRPPTGPLDAAIITPESVDEAVYFAGKLRPRLSEGTTPGVLILVVPAALSDPVDDLVPKLEGSGYAQGHVQPITEDLVLIRCQAGKATDPLND